MSRRDSQGFTLMEMLIVVTIIGILAAIILPRFVTSSASAKTAAYNAEKQTINAQIELFQFQIGSYPSAMTEAGWGGADTAALYWPDGVPTADPLGRAWTIDTTISRIADPE
jgi:general secretion pathway protein G